jgi:citrate synthase
MSKKAVLYLGDQQIELPVLVGAEGEMAVDISRLRDATGLTAYDPSLSNTAICESSVTFIDGEKGILRYRGIPIEQLVEHPNFIETAWLLIFGRLPKKDELDRFSQRLTLNELLHEGMTQQYQHVPADAPPMALLSATLSNLACYHPQFLAPGGDEPFEESAAQLISKVRTIAAFSYRRSLGLPFNYPDPRLRYCANFLHMLFSNPCQQYDIAPEIEGALNLIFYSGILFRLLGIPTNMITVCFAIGRLPGWIAQWKEQHDDSTSKILRPRQVYIGIKAQDYVPIENR